MNKILALLGFIVGIFYRLLLVILFGIITGLLMLVGVGRNLDEKLNSPPDEQE